MPPEVPDIVAGLLLVGLGFFNIWIERRKAGEKPEGPLGSQVKEQRLGLRETMVLAGALSINNVGLGFAGGFAGLDHGPVALSVGGFSILLLWLGLVAQRGGRIPAELSVLLAAARWEPDDRGYRHSRTVWIVVRGRAGLATGADPRCADDEGDGGARPRRQSVDFAALLVDQYAVQTEPAKWMGPATLGFSRYTPITCCETR